MGGSFKLRPFAPYHDGRDLLHQLSPRTRFGCLLRRVSQGVSRVGTGSGFVRFRHFMKSAKRPSAESPSAIKTLVGCPLYLARAGRKRLGDGRGSSDQIFDQTLGYIQQAFLSAKVARCPGCIALHVKAMHKPEGARAELKDMLAVCVCVSLSMGGGLGLMYVAGAVKA